MEQASNLVPHFIYNNTLNLNNIVYLCAEVCTCAKYVCPGSTEDVLCADFVRINIHLSKPFDMRKKEIEELCRMTVEEFRAAEKLPLVIVLDNVRSLHNVGSVFRTADAFCLERVCLCGITACPPAAEIHKTALGAEDTVEWKYYADTMDAVRELHDAGYTILAVEQVEGSLKLGEFQAEPGERYALILGNEVKGVRQDVVDACDQALEIPQYGMKHSLNVSVTAGIVMWEVSQAMRQKSLAEEVFSKLGKNLSLK